MAAKGRHRHRSDSLITLIFIKLGHCDSLLMSTPYKLSVNSVNMTQEQIQIIAAEPSINTNGRQHYARRKHRVVIQYEQHCYH